MKWYNTVRCLQPKNLQPRPSYAHQTSRCRSNGIHGLYDLHIGPVWFRESHRHPLCYSVCHVGSHCACFAHHSNAAIPDSTLGSNNGGRRRSPVIYVSQLCSFAAATTCSCRACLVGGGMHRVARARRRATRGGCPDGDRSRWATRGGCPYDNA